MVVERGRIVAGDNRNYTCRPSTRTQPRQALANQPCGRERAQAIADIDSNAPSTTKGQTPSSSRAMLICISTLSQLQYIERFEKTCSVFNHERYCITVSM